jgi:hypothetical protein
VCEGRIGGGCPEPYGLASREDSAGTDVAARGSIDRETWSPVTLPETYGYWPDAVAERGQDAIIIAHGADGDNRKAIVIVGTPATVGHDHLNWTHFRPVDHSHTVE